MRASILHNTNRLIASSEDSWASVRDNTMVRINTDNNFYTIGNVKSFFYIKEFQTISPNVIRVNGEASIELVEGDTIKVTYKEYETLTILNSLNSGSKYKVSDILFLEGGVPVKDSFTGQILPAKFIVNSVDENGGIIQLRMESEGRYITPPKEKCNLIGSNTGEGAQVEVSYKVSDNRSISEKTILKIDKQSGYFVITLDSLLPQSVSTGKISVDKWEAILTSNYAGTSQINKPIDFIRDFTPFMKIPLILRGNTSPEAIYNMALLTVDKKIQELTEEIQKIKENRRR